MKHSDRTTMGGDKSVFQTTVWSDICLVRTLDQGRRDAAINDLIKAYWKPVYCYLRRKGLDNERAKDLTQGFFEEIVLGRQLVQRADETKGRFRTFLLTALDRYVTSVHRRDFAAKRRPKEGIIPLQDLDETSVSVAAEGMSPGSTFNYVWASELLQAVLANVQEGCEQDGKQVHWQLFHARVLNPIISGAEPPSLAELCERLNVAGTVKAENMIVTVKRRFQAALRRHIRDHVESEEDVDEEIRDLMNILSG
ncbi:MAG: sigma-70 family RNA polymerase sigma factor [Phycisphaerales bacterium]|nr:MAG: sigma-70 family RNA polymerase sigma factor [Phycisphaerales bacterium]